MRITSAPGAASALLAAALMATSAAAATIDFGGQSMGTSRPITVRVAPTGLLPTATPVPFVVLSSNPEFVPDQTGCTTLTATPCTFTLTFKPNTVQGAVNGRVATSATVVISGADPVDFYRISLTGMGERSLITHFYQQILQRQPDLAGKTFWETEASRMVVGGADVKEVWYVMSKAFAASTEAQQKSATVFAADVDFVDWLYQIYYNRDGDAAGVNFWTAQLGAGLSRESALLTFMLSPEFTSLSTSLFGNTTARPEVTLVGDFYRGILGRLPDDDGLRFWVGRLKGAQCSGAAAVRTEADAIASQFLGSAEYTQRGRSTVQFVTDLYDAFLRRGPDAAGAGHWISELNSGALTPTTIRASFIGSAEFAARVDAVIAAGCSP